MLRRAARSLLRRQVLSQSPNPNPSPSPSPSFMPRRSMGGFSGGHNSMNYPKLAVREKEMRIIHKVATAVSRKDALSKSQFQRMCRKLGFRRCDLDLFLKKFTLIFELSEHDTSKHVKLTDLMHHLMQREKQTMKLHEPYVVTTLRKLLMLAKGGRLPVKKLLLLKRTFGFPEEFEKTILPKYPQFFEVVKDENRDEKFVELRLWDPALAVTARETRRKSFSSGQVDKFCEGGPFSFRVPFENNCRLKEEDHRMLVKMQKRPFLSPYDHSETELEPSRKRNLAMCHEFLSLTVLKRAVLRDLMIFQEEFLLPRDLTGFFKASWLFFAHASLSKHIYVFLREAYHSDYVVERTPYVNMWRRYVELALVSRKRRPLKKSLLLPDDPRRDRRAPSSEGGEVTESVAESSPDFST